MARWKAHGRLSIRINSLYVLRFQSYEANCVGLQLGCFRRSRPLCTQILPEQGRPPSTILGNRKLETLGYRTMKTVLCQNEGTQRDASSRIPLHSLVLTQYRSVTDRRTDGQTDGYVVAYTAACKASFAYVAL